MLEDRELNKVYILWWTISSMVLAAVFATGVTKPNALPFFFRDHPTRPVNTRPHFDRVSEFLIENQIDARLLGSSPTPGGFMFRIPQDPRLLDDRWAYDGYWIPTKEDLERRWMYPSQFGLQGRLYAAAAGAIDLGRSETVKLFQSLTAAALAAMLSVLILLIRRDWGVPAALSAFAFCVLSTGFNLFAPSLYWVTFLQVAPAAVVSAALLANLREKWQWLLVYLIVLILLTAKFLSGFEFLTVIVGATTMPFFIAFSTGRLTARELLGRSAVTIAAGITAFVLALTFYNHHYASTFGESGIEYLLSRADEWTVRSKGMLHHLRDLARMFLLNLVDYNSFGLPNLLAMAAGGALLLATGRRLLLRAGFENERSRIILTMAAAFSVSASWLVLQLQHVMWHPRYTSFILAYPFGLVLAAGVARLVSSSQRPVARSVS